MKVIVYSLFQNPSIYFNSKSREKINKIKNELKNGSNNTHKCTNIIKSEFPECKNITYRIGKLFINDTSKENNTCVVTMRANTTSLLFFDYIILLNDDDSIFLTYLLSGSELFQKKKTVQMTCVRDVNIEDEILNDFSLGVKIRY